MAAPMALEALLARCDPRGQARVQGPVVRRVDRIVMTPEQAGPGAIVAGLLHPDAAWVHACARRGAAAVIVDRDLPVEAEPTRIVLPRPGPVVGRISALLNGDPSEVLQLVAVTGTNGKTTTTFFCRQLTAAAGLRFGVLGTNGFDVGQEILAPWRTTPYAPDLHALFARMVRAGLHGAAIEASSAGLIADRLIGAEVDVAVFTNLTPDHVDDHPDPEAYFAAKRRLFIDPEQPRPPRLAVIDRDDPAGRRLLADGAMPCPTVSVSRRADADVRAVGITPLDPADPGRGVRFDLASPWGRWPVALPLPGAFNVSNALAAFAACAGLGMPPDRLAAAFEGLTLPRGRLEEHPVDEGGFRVFVDYAHNVGAITEALAAVRPLARGRVIAVLGASGTGRRVPSDIGRAVGRGADLCVLTTNDPDRTPVAALSRAVAAGLPDGLPHTFIEDRRAAIAHAVALAEPGDVVVALGKGHERTQLVRGEKVPYDEQESVAAALRARRARAAGSP